MEYFYLASAFKYWHGQLTNLPRHFLSDPLQELLRINYQLLNLLDLLPDTFSTIQAKKEAGKYLIAGFLLSDNNYYFSGPESLNLEDAILNLQVAVEIILECEDAVYLRAG